MDSLILEMFHGRARAMYVLALGRYYGHHPCGAKGES